MAMKETSVKVKFMTVVGLLKWVELDPEDVRDTLCSPSWNGQVFLSPDVNSLHIVWTDTSAPGTVWHEIADYPYPSEEVSLTDFLCFEVLDDSWDVHEGVEDVYATLSDLRVRTLENTPQVTVAQLERGKGEYTPWGVLPIR